MPSKKWKIWDFFRNISHHIGKESLHAFICKDTFVLQEIKTQLKSFWPESSELKIVFGEELTTEWWEDNFLSLSLFGNSESYIVLNASSLKSDHLEILKREDLFLQDRKVFFLFNQENDFCKKMVKNDNVNVHILEEAKHWEGRELFDFWCSQFKLSLSYQAKEKALILLNHESSEFINLLKVLEVNHADKKEISLSHLEEVITPTRFNKFELAELFCSRKFKEFYQKLLDLNPNKKEIEDFAYFMQGHLIKVLDPSLISQKNYLSKYDKNIMSHSRLWNEQKLQNAMIYFEEIVLRSRNQDPFLDFEFKTKLLSL